RESDDLVLPHSEESPKLASARMERPHSASKTRVNALMLDGGWYSARENRGDAPKRSQLRTHPHIDRERLRRRDRAVVEQHVRYRDRDRRLRIEEGAESRELAIEQVVYEPVDLQLLRELVRAVQVR